MLNWLKQKEQLIIKAILWLSFALLIFLILLKYFVPFGKITYSWRTGETSPYISSLTPKERVSLNAEGNWQIGSGPAYFKLNTTRIYDKLKLKIKYKTKGFSGIEAGVLVDNKLKGYSLTPVYNLALEKILASGDWGVIEENGVLLMQKNEAYTSLKNFFAKPPKVSEVAIYNYEWPEALKITDYKAGRGYKTNWPIVGAASMRVYIKDEPLVLELLVSDKNLNKDNDEAVLELRNEKGDLIESKVLADDNLPVGQESSPRIVKIVKNNLPEGVYKLNWRAGNDVVINSLTTAQSKFIFVNNLRLGSYDKPISLVLSGPNLGAVTIDPKAVQTVKIANYNLVVGESYQNYNAKVDCSRFACPLNLERGGLSLSTNGFIALEPRGLIGNAVTKIDQYFQFNENIKYIIADYKQSLEKDEWQEAEVELNLKKAYRENGHYDITFSLPKGERGEFIISSIDAELVGKGVVKK